jgi:hypothetical protein
MPTTGKVSGQWSNVTEKQVKMKARENALTLIGMGVLRGDS